MVSSSRNPIGLWYLLPTSENYLRFKNLRTSMNSINRINRVGQYLRTMPATPLSRRLAEL